MLAGSQLAIWVIIKADLVAPLSAQPGTAFRFFDFQLRVNVLHRVEAPIKSLAALSTWGCLWIWVLVWLSRIRHDFLNARPVGRSRVSRRHDARGFLPEIRIYGEDAPAHPRRFLGCVSRRVSERRAI
jgi:hypothetical protein